MRRRHVDSWIGAERQQAYRVLFQCPILHGTVGLLYRLNPHQYYHHRHHPIISLGWLKILWGDVGGCPLAICDLAYLREGL